MFLLIRVSVIEMRCTEYKMKVVRTHSELCRDKGAEERIKLKEHPGLLYSAISFPSLFFKGRVQRYCVLKTMNRR